MMTRYGTAKHPVAAVVDRGDRLTGLSEAGYSTAARKRAFTLIELLVVIGIIGILVAMLLPAVIGAMNTAEKGKAKADIKSIENALKLYAEDYRKFPLTTSSDQDWTSGNKDVIEALRGMNTANNPLKRMYLDVSDTSISTNSKSMIDPWDNPYRISVDGNNDNASKTAGCPAGRTVWVWSAEQDAKDDSPLGAVDDICSWKM